MLPRVTASALLVLLAAAGCASMQRVSLVSRRVALPDGRFVGPVEVKVPRHRDHGGHDFEVRVRVVAKCDPRFTLAFPDGEQRPLGVEDSGWQALLKARAGVIAQAAAALPPPPPPQRAPGPVAAERFEPQPYPAAPSSPQLEAEVSVDAEARLPAPTVGHWERTVTERWPGQLVFEEQRGRRCAGTREFTARYRNAFDDTNTVALWAEVPQELEGGELFVDVDELLPPRVEPPPPPKPAQRPVARPAPQRTVPPMPPPRAEHPDPAQDAGARWRPGHWSWQGDGGWVWIDGDWLPPAAAPALRVEVTGQPPVPGCRWKSGHWVWVARGGRWDWVPGSWLAPPPLAEDRGVAPDPTAPWEPGAWLPGNGTFTWRPGRWGRPQPRADVQPPAPRPDAQWVPGEWLFFEGRWTWSPGFWTGTERPPPPRPEVIPPRPHPDAAWLAGFWRWDARARVHAWVDGHWELPPGEGYVWVEEKLGPDLVLRGHWELKVQR